MTYSKEVEREAQKLVVDIAAAQMEIAFQMFLKTNGEMQAYHFARLYNVHREAMKDYAEICQ
jgi:hypothetical protein